MIGEVRRVVYDPRAWTKTPSRMIRHGVAISVDPYTMVTSETIYLIGTHSRDAVLYVFPQTSTIAVVDRVLDAIRASDAPMDTSVLRHLVAASRVPRRKRRDCGHRSDEPPMSRFCDVMYANARASTRGMVTGEPHAPVRHSWAEVHDRARRIAGGLAAAGVGPGEAGRRAGGSARRDRARPPRRSGCAAPA